VNPYPLSFLPAWLPIAGWTAYQLLLATSCTLGFALVMPWASRNHLPRGRVFLTLVAVMLAALVGARWLPWLLSGCPRFDAASDLPLFVHGGLAGAVLALAVSAWLAELPLVGLLDALAVPFALGLALSRVGCFLTGCDFGSPCGGFPLGVRYPAWTAPSGHLANPPALLDHLARGWLPAGATASLPVHPVQLYEAALGFTMAAFLMWRSRRRPTPAPGQLAALTLLVYGLGRFVLELLRGDADRGVGVLGSLLSAPQLVSLALVAAGWAWSRRLTRRATR
jgi:phosphatidylglycerol:prolipoprotein diacylglycerol transferase